jgi:ferredoxin-NADP reductase
MLPARYARSVPCMLELLIADKRSSARGVVSLILESPDRSDLPSWEPGAHVDVHLPGGKIRQYSLCGDPEVANQWRIAVLLEPEGRGGSKSVHEDLAVGAHVSVGAPRNNFRLQPSEQYLLLGGGIGITPLIPMATVLSRKGARTTLVYCGRDEGSMAFTDELRALDNEFVAVPENKCGRPDFVALISRLDPGATVYCCGPPGMIDAVRRACSSRADIALRVEQFGSSADASDATSRAFEVELVQSGIVAEIPAGTSILEVLDRIGVFVPSACQSGVCGSCIVPVLAGEVDHHDTVLTDEERAAGDQMCLCVSRGLTPRLILDV